MNVRTGLAVQPSPSTAPLKGAGRVYTLPCADAAVELARIYMAVSNESQSESLRTTGTVKGMSGVDKTNSIVNAIGSLGMILGAIKRPTDEHNTFGFFVLNDTEHVVVPHRVRCNGDFYATSNLDIMTPSQTSTLNFNINRAFNGNLDVYLEFAVCAKNSKAAGVDIHFTRASNGEIAPYSFNVDYGNVLLDRNQMGSSSNTNTLLYAAAVGSDGFPSFGLAVVASTLNSHQLGVVLTPWRPV